MHLLSSREGCLAREQNGGENRPFEVLLNSSDVKAAQCQA